jgi:nicotinamidase/pyrazinamidase
MKFMYKNSALVMIDLQQDFCQYGSLYVPDADAIIPIANSLMPLFSVIVATQDWHPKQHVSFAVTHDKEPGISIMVDEITQQLWPTHCVQHTSGADLHHQLQVQRITKFIRKGSAINIDSYSAFFDNAKLNSTGLTEYLHQQQINNLYLLGVATEFCVKYSCQDALALGFTVNLIGDACRGVELQPGDINKTLAGLIAQGVSVIDSASLFN